MSNQRKVLLIWNDENYSNLEEAIKDGAITRHVIPSRILAYELDSYIKGYTQALIDSGERLVNNHRALGMKIITETLRSVAVEVLEWNTYHFDVWANNAKEAQQIAMAEGVSLSHNDVEYGTAGYTPEENTDNRLVDK